jgi:hypothetical protein
LKLDDLKILEGFWLCKIENSETEEFWLPAKGKMILGLNRTVANSGKSAFEFLRIYQQEEEIFYTASPNGKPATLFKLIEFQSGKMIFENLEHDFPQRIVYTFQAENEMIARIEGEVNGKLKFTEWKFIRQNQLIK